MTGGGGVPLAGLPLRIYRDGRVRTDPAGPGASDYERYLRTDELLALQKTADEWVHRDELLFQTVHQSSELWLKHAWNEVEEATRLVERARHRRRAAPAAARERVVRYVIGFLEHLELMSPWEYQEIRRVLGHGSGFDSPGFREIRRVSPPLYAAFDGVAEGARALAARGVHARARARRRVPARRGARRLGRADRHLALPPREDGRRVIGEDVVGTQGTPVELLAGLIKHKMFPELWRVRTELTSSPKNRIDPARRDPPRARAHRRRRAPHAARASRRSHLAEARVPPADRLVQAPRRAVGRPRGVERRARGRRRHRERRQHGAGRRVGGARGGRARAHRRARARAAREARRGRAPRRRDDPRLARGVVAGDGRPPLRGRRRALRPSRRGRGGDGRQRDDRPRARRGSPRLRHGRHPMGRRRADDGNRERREGVASRRAVVTAEPETAAPFAAALAAGGPVEIDYRPSFVDGAGGRALLPTMWDRARGLVDEAVAVPLDDVAEAMRELAARARVVAEGAGALALAAARRRDDRCVCIVERRQRRRRRPRARAHGRDAAVKIAIVLFDGVEELDWAGPWEVFSAWMHNWPEDGATVVHRRLDDRADRVREGGARARRPHVGDRSGAGRRALAGRARHAPDARRRGGARARARARRGRRAR